LSGKEKAGQKPGHLPIWVWTVSDGVKLLCRSGHCRRTGVLAGIGWKIRPSRETQCDCTSDDEDDSHLMSPLTSFGFVRVKLGVCRGIFCVQNHKKTDFEISFAQPDPHTRGRKSARETGRFRLFGF
jgi:hypothetical protein